MTDHNPDLPRDLDEVRKFCRFMYRIAAVFAATRVFAVVVGSLL